VARKVPDVDVTGEEAAYQGRGGPPRVTDAVDRAAAPLIGCLFSGDIHVGYFASHRATASTSDVWKLKAGLYPGIQLSPRPFNTALMF
jgi:hypothetical protein